MQHNVTAVRESFRRSILSDVFGKFYDIFLNSHSDIKRMFLHTDLKSQKELLKHGIQLAILFADGNPVATQGLSRIKQTHGKGKMAIPPQMYRLWKSSFLTAIEQTDPQFSPQVRQEWDRVLQKTIDYIASP